MSEVELSEPPQTGGYTVTLPMFEGPLDLLLHLCQKHELDILDIPIAFVTEKYLEYLAVMQLMSLDVASEYLVMAATLAHIKSKMLLPAPPPGQEDELASEEEDPREALIRRLLEYQKYKHAGEELANRGVAGRDVFMRGMPIEEAVHTGLPPLAQVPLFSLVEAFQTVLSKSSVKLSHDIVHERVTLADRINELVDVLRTRRRMQFEELFEGLETRFDLVITFLALLEMTRLRMTRLYQESFESPIIIEFTAQVTADDDPDAAATAEAAQTAVSDALANGLAEASPAPDRSMDTEAPPPGETTGIDSGFADEDLASALDTEAPPAMELDVPTEGDEVDGPRLQTIPSPALGDALVDAPGDDTSAEAEALAAEDASASSQGDGDGAGHESESESDDAWTAGQENIGTSRGEPLTEDVADDERSTLVDVPGVGGAGIGGEGETGGSERTTLFDVPGEEDTLDGASVTSALDVESPGEPSGTSTQGSDDRGDAAPSGDEDT